MYKILLAQVNQHQQIRNLDINVCASERIVNNNKELNFSDITTTMETPHKLFTCILMQSWFNEYKNIQHHNYVHVNCIHQKSSYVCWQF